MEIPTNSAGACKLSLDEDEDSICRKKCRRRGRISNGGTFYIKNIVVPTNEKETPLDKSQVIVLLVLRSWDGDVYALMR